MRVALIIALATLSCRPEADSAGAGTPSPAARASTRAEPARSAFDSLSAPASQERAEAARVLALRGDAEAWRALLPALADDAPEVMRFAAFGLGRKEA